MSGEVLREAARLMRERAEAATSSPWSIRTYEGFSYETQLLNAEGEDIATAESGYVSADFDSADAEHIASWHPAVALAVADLLDVISWFPSQADPTDMNAALALARTYLGSDQ